MCRSIYLNVVICNSKKCVVIVPPTDSSGTSYIKEVFRSTSTGLVGLVTVSSKSYGKGGHSNEMICE